MSRILYFTRDYNPHDHRFLSALAETEHQVYFLSLEEREHPLETRPLPPKIHPVHWARRHTPLSLEDIPQLLPDFQRILSEVQPDLVQAGPIQRSAYLVALSGFQPLLSMSWGYDLIQDAQLDSAWEQATRFTLQHSTLLLGDSQVIRQLATAYGMPEERVVTFPWGIDLQHFTPASERVQTAASHSHQPPNFTLLSTRGWEPIYGIEIIAQAFARAASHIPELRLVMLGNGSQAGLVRDIFSQSGVLDRVTFPGQVGFSELPNYYRQADLYLSASHSDGTSISLLEAMACGLPVLVSDIPGNLEWVSAGENGWTFPDGNIAALAHSIIQAVSQRQQLPLMGQRARRLVEEKADWQQNFPRLLATYQFAQEIAMTP
jgi:glycosyltransferase involved in cell wall biosynthesis